MQVAKKGSGGKKKGGCWPPTGQAPVPDETEVDRFGGKLRALGPEAGKLALRLVIANRVQMWADCPHEVCRRARACRADDMVCFEERRDELKRKVLQEVVLMLCTADISSGEFYDYLDEVTADPEEDGGDPEAW